MKPERKLWLDLKKNTPTICWNRIENMAVPGLPDLLGFSKYQHFFTVELKVSRSNSVRLSPHQIAFHLRHPKNTFIITEALGPSASKTCSISMYHGSRIRELAACGLELEACRLGLDACGLLFESLGA